LVSLQGQVGVILPGVKPAVHLQGTAELRLGVSIPAQGLMHHPQAAHAQGHLRVVLPEGELAVHLQGFANERFGVHVPAPDLE
jgi:hypothetical protein